jgi:hypothetical protein
MKAGRFILLLVGFFVAAAIAVVAFAAYDLSRPASQRTHIGRFARQLLDGDGGIIVERKVDANLHVLLSPAVIFGVALAAGLSVLAWRRSAPFAQVRARVPGVGPLVVGAALAAVLGASVNDSGVAVPAIMLAVLVPWWCWVALELVPP